MAASPTRSLLSGAPAETADAVPVVSSSRPARAVILPPIAAVICTRNRGDVVARAAASVLANDHPSFRLIVVDQSSDDRSEQAMKALQGDPRLQFLRSRTVGVSRARNDGLNLCDTEIVCFTDDDCEVPPTWLRDMQQIFAIYPRVVATFCSVREGPHNRAEGFIPSYECAGTRVIGQRSAKHTARGMGAGLALRRREMLELGGFDEELGPGARFPSCEDGDIIVRVLLRGYQVCETDSTHVIHHGIRTWREGKELSKRDWVGIGAACAKPLRAGEWAFVSSAVYELLVKGMGPPLRDLLRGRVPRGSARGFHFMNGFVRGMLTPVDRQHLVFHKND
jgi:glycosyltransferase involved in cell wall biosynthesis